MTAQLPEQHQYAKCCCCRRSTFRLSTFLVLFVGYLCIGSACFMWIEQPIEERERRHILDKRRAFLGNNTCVTEDKLDSLIRHVIEANDMGVSVTDKNNSYSNWGFGQSIFFSMTVVTTIGYGRTTPLSELGKMFCIIYALIGIPLTLIMFTAMVERLYEPAIGTLTWMQGKLMDKFSLFDIRFLHFAISVTIVAIFFILIPSAIFTYLEKDWNYLDSVYYCFISLTTIGLGDFIPGEKHAKYRDLYKILITVYLFLGLIAMIFILRVFHDIPELNVGLLIYQKSDILPEERQIVLGSKDEKRKTYTEEQTADVQDAK